MDNFFQNVTKYISNNPTFILVIIAALIIVIIWLLIKNKNSTPSKFLSTKEKLSKKKKNIKNENDSDEEDESDTKITKPKIDNKKNTADPDVSQLVNDINQNS